MKSASFNDPAFSNQVERYGSVSTLKSTSVGGFLSEDSVLLASADIPPRSVHFDKYGSGIYTPEHRFNYYTMYSAEGGDGSGSLLFFR